MTEKELFEKNLEFAKLHRDEKQPLVYVKVSKMRSSRLEGIKLEVV